MKKKLPNNLSTAELLEALEKSTPDIIEIEDVVIDMTPVNQEYSSEYNNILLFCSKYSIYPGNNPIRVQLLYKLYKLSTPHPVNYTKFKNFILDYLVYSKNTKTYLDVLINKESLLLSKEVEALFLKKQQYKRNEANVKKYERAMKLFLEELSIGTGNIPIELETLYYFYDKWSYKRRKIAIPFISFKRLCTLFLSISSKSTMNSENVIKVRTSFIENLPVETLKTAKEWGKKFVEREKNRRA